jgi:DNA-binding MarR family transcriptional regulator
MKIIGLSVFSHTDKNGEQMSNREFIGKFVSFLYRYSQMYLDKELKPYNIGPGQFYLLMPLFQKDGVNQESLAQSINLDRANVTRAIQKLIKEGYVYRQTDDEDRRSHRIFLTEKGKAIEPGLKKIALEWENILLSNFDSDQRQTIVNSFEDMIKNVSRIIEK